MKPSNEFTELLRLTGAVRVPAQRLAVSIGNYEGANDFARKRPRLDCAFVLSEMQNDLIAMVALRAYALVAPMRQPTDATLHGAAALLRKPAVRNEAIALSKNWALPNAQIASIRMGYVEERLDQFLKAIDGLDIDMLRDFRHWVLAHITTNPTPLLKLGVTLRIGKQILEAVDKLSFVVSGDEHDVLSLSENRRLQALHFWENFDPNDLAPVALEANDTGLPIG